MRDKEKHAKEKLETVLNDMAHQPRGKTRQGGRRGHFARRFQMDRHSAQAHGAGRNRSGCSRSKTEMDKSGHRPARSGFRHVQGAAPFARGFERSASGPIGTFALLGPTGVGKTLLAKTLAEQMFGDAKVAHPTGHERIHGEIQCLAPGRFAAGLCRLRGRRPAHRTSAPQSVFRGAVRRNRKGASGRVEHAVADFGRRQTDRQRRPRGQFPQHHHPDDVERRLGHDQEAVHAGLLADHATRAATRRCARRFWKRPSGRSARNS